MHTSKLHYLFFFKELSKQKKEEKLNLAVKYSKIGKFQRSKRKCA